MEMKYFSLELLEASQKSQAFLRTSLMFKLGQIKDLFFFFSFLLNKS